jgi:hypothetical protein
MAGREKMFYLVTKLSVARNILRRWSIGGMIVTGKSEILEDKPVPLCLPEIPHKMTSYYQIEASCKHQPIYPKRISHRHAFGTEVCGSQIQSGQCGEEGNILPLLEMEPESSCSVATHYTN